MELFTAPRDIIGVAADFLHGRLGGIKGQALLVDVVEDGLFPHRDLAGGGRLLGHQHAEQGGFAHAIPADNPGAGTGGEAEIEMGKQGALRDHRGDADGVHDDVAHGRRRRDQQRHFLLLFGTGLAGDIVIGIEPALALGGAGFDAGAHPFDLAAQESLAAVLLGLVVGAAFGAGTQISAVVAFMHPDLAGIQFRNAGGDAVEEIPVVGDEEAGVRGVGEVFLQPADGFGIEVVGRFIQQQQVGLGNQGAGEGHAAFFASGKQLDTLVRRGAVQFRHGGTDAGIQVPPAEVLDA